MKEPINTVENKRVALGDLVSSKTQRGDERDRITDFIRRKNVELSKDEVSLKRYKGKKIGETNVFEGIRHGVLYDVYRVKDKLTNIIYEVWRSVNKDSAGQRQIIMSEVTEQIEEDMYA